MTHADPPISDLYKCELEGQPVTVNKVSKVVVLELREVFGRAGIVFKWPAKYGWQAFGLNSSILRLIELGRYKLLINFHSKESRIEYWINHDELRKFVENNKCVKQIRGVKLFNVPLVLFHPKPTFGIDNDQGGWN